MDLRDSSVPRSRLGASHGQLSHQAVLAVQRVSPLRSLARPMVALCGVFEQGRERLPEVFDRGSRRRRLR
jgi:hypothetical protein